MHIKNHTQDQDQLFSLIMLIVGFSVLLGLVIVMKFGSSNARMHASGGVPIYGVQQYPQPYPQPFPEIYDPVPQRMVTPNIPVPNISTPPIVRSTIPQYSPVVKKKATVQKPIQKKRTKKPSGWHWR